MKMLEAGIFARYRGGVRARSEHTPPFRRVFAAVTSHARKTDGGAGGTPQTAIRLTLQRDLNSLFDGTRDLGSRLFGVFPRPKRQRDERSLVLAADAEAVARKASPA